MNKQTARILINLLEKSGVHFAKGLSNEEVITVQHHFNVKFPPDLRLFLQTALPISGKFINWRAGLSSTVKEKQIIERINWPLEGLLFDIENNEFWMADWGDKPDSVEQQKEIAEQHYRQWPKLIPIYSHRYIPSVPYEEGNPVLSVYQTDIIYYGNDLAAYFKNEFRLTLPEGIKPPDEPKKIDFWGYFLDGTIFRIGD
ncbi:hypothetical protein [Budvicia diplopodorum]|uniref:hypothetical protein n=1 Tax=Budvicia diplopodorum TaxID=1119056 RepID=UPI00135944F0|nr:hypothetical protein [Budvicia diplopodorum]